MQIAKKAIGTTGDASAYGKRMRRMQMGAGRGNGNYDLWKANCKKRLIGQPKPMWNSKSDRRMQISRPRKAPNRNFQETILCAKHMGSQSWKPEKNIEKSGRAQTLPFFFVLFTSLPAARAVPKAPQTARPRAGRPARARAPD